MARTIDELPYSSLNATNAQDVEGTPKTMCASLLRRRELPYLTACASLLMLCTFVLSSGGPFHLQAVPADLIGGWAPGQPGLWESGAFETSIEFHMPYINFVEDLYVHSDAQHGLMRLSYYSGANVFLLNSSGKAFQILPVVDHLECLYAAQRTRPEAVVPDLSTFHEMGSWREVDLIDDNGLYSIGFEFTLSTGDPVLHDSMISDRPQDTWTYFDAKTRYAYAGNYTFIVNATAGGTPVNLTFKGHNGFLVNSHYDEYHIVYKSFYKRENGIDAALFYPPRGMPCTNFNNVQGPFSPGPSMAQFGPITALRDLALALPSRSSKDYHQDAARPFEKYVQRHASSQLNMRRQVAMRNYQFIQAANRRGLPYSLGVNHMVTWLPHERKKLCGRRQVADHVRPEELVARIVPDLCRPLTGQYEVDDDGKTIRRSGVHAKHLEHSQLKPFLAAKLLPTELDLAMLGHVGTVKDQGTCGSCWAFAAVAALEGQYSKKMGSFVPLSEQQLIDCTWGAGCKGCDGCDAHNAYSWLLQENSGKFRSTDEYGPYLSQDGFCHIHKFKNGILAQNVGQPSPHKGKFNGSISLMGCSFLDASVPNSDFTEKARIDMLSLTLFVHGPAAIDISASDDDFYYYASGIYNDPKCSSTILDHAVTLTGYGVDKRLGLSYWIIRNSWSVHWGERGYIRLAQKGNVCGVLSKPVIPHLL